MDSIGRDVRLTSRYTTDRIRTWSSLDCGLRSCSSERDLSLSRDHDRSRPGQLFHQLDGRRERPVAETDVDGEHALILRVIRGEDELAPVFTRPFDRLQLERASDASSSKHPVDT